MAFDARNVRILALSVDTQEVSAEFAKKYKLNFPLLEDKDLAIARQYMGVDANGFSLPGVVLVDPDGTVALRQVGTTPGDRIYAADLLKIIDGMLEQSATAGTGGKPGVLGGYEPLQRFNLRVGATLGIAQERATENELGFSIDANLAGLYPLGRYFMVGGLARVLTGSTTRADVDVAVRVRVPVIDDNAEWYAQIPFGLTVDFLNADDGDHESLGWNTGLTVGLQFAPTPSMAIFLELESMAHRFPGRAPLDQRLELRVQAGGGISFLF